MLWARHTGLAAMLYRRFDMVDGAGGADEDGTAANDGLAGGTVVFTRTRCA